MRSLGGLLTFCSFVVVSPDVADEEMLALLDSCSGLTRSSRRASFVTRLSHFLDSLLTLGFYEALSLEVMHEEPRVLFGRLACAWLPRGRLA